VTGWLPLIAIVALALGLLWVLRVRGAMLQLSAAALLFGAAGMPEHANARQPRRLLCTCGAGQQSR